MRHLSWLCVLCMSATLQAREVDQYLAWGTDLRDEGPSVDRYMRAQMADALDELALNNAMNSSTYKGNFDINGDYQVNALDYDIFVTELLATPALQPGPSGVCLFSSLPDIDCEGDSGGGCH